jgi:predicted nucleic acid-binding protein
MQEDFMLLDTNVLSEARNEQPSLDVIRFLLRLRRGSIALPLPAIFELERGAQMLMPHDPETAWRRIAWLEGLLKRDVFIPEWNTRTIRLYAQMSNVPRLRHFWETDAEGRRMNFGCDPAIAAISIVHEIPVATSNIKDFLQIHRHFPLPGLFSPTTSEWHVDPPDDWDVLSDEVSHGDTIVIPENIAYCVENSASHGRSECNFLIGTILGHG